MVAAVRAFRSTGWQCHTFFSPCLQAFDMIDHPIRYTNSPMHWPSSGTIGYRVIRRDTDSPSRPADTWWAELAGCLQTHHQQEIIQQWLDGYVRCHIINHPIWAWRPAGTSNRIENWPLYGRWCNFVWSLPRYYYTCVRMVVPLYLLFICIRDE